MGQKSRECLRKYSNLLREFKMDDLYPIFESHLIELIVLLHGVVPNVLMETVEFFIMEQRMSSVCRTNMSLAHKIGKLSANATGVNAILIRALYLLVIARDGMLKGYCRSEVEHLLDQVSKLIKVTNEWKITELNY